MKLVFLFSLLIIFFVLNGCSTQKGSKEIRTPASEQETAEFLTRCQSGDMYFCYRAGAEEEENGNIKQARSLYLKACNGQFGMGCEFLGILYEKEGNSTEAEKSYSKACKIGWMEGCSSLGFINEKRGNFKKAKKLYSKACYSRGAMGACEQLCNLVEKEGENKNVNRHHQEYCKERKEERKREGRRLSHGLKIGPHDTGLYGFPMEESQEKMELTGRSVILGNMDPDIIRKILRDNVPLFSNCYQKGMNEKEVITGQVKLEFTIGPSGSVTMTSVIPSDSKIPKSVITCIKKVLQEIKFPPPKGGGTVEVIQALNLQLKKK